MPSNIVAGNTVPVTEGIITGTTKSKLKIDKTFKIIKHIPDKFPIFIRGAFRSSQCFSVKPILNFVTTGTSCRIFL